MQKWLSKHFYFPRMFPIIEEYVESGKTCNRVNPPNRTLGLMQQPTIPITRWSHISMDIVSGFTSTSFQGREVDSALVILDIFSNRVHFYPISNKLSGEDISKYIYLKFIIHCTEFQKLIHQIEVLNLELKYL